MNTNDANSSSSSSVFANFLVRPLSSSGRIITSSSRPKRRLSLTIALKKDNTNNEHDDHATTTKESDVLVGIVDSKVDNKLSQDLFTSDDDNHVLVSCRRSSINVARELWGDMGADDGGLSPEALAALSGSRRQSQQNQSFSWAISSATRNIGDANAIAAHQGDVKTQTLRMVPDDDDEEEEVATRINIDSTKMSTEFHLPSLTSNKAILRAKIDEMSRKLVQTRQRTGESRILVHNHVPTKPSFPTDHDQSCSPAKKRRRDAELTDAPEGLWRHFASDFFSKD